MLSTTPVRDDGRLMSPIRRYQRWVLISVSIYAVLLVTTLLALPTLPAEAIGLRAAFGLLPVMPLLLQLWAVIRYVREVDEMQRQIELQSIAFAAMATGIGFMAAGFLATAGVFALDGPAVAIWVLPSLFGSYGIAKVFVQRSYGG